LRAWEARYDIRPKRSKNIYKTGLHRLEEGVERSYGDSPGRDETGSVQRERLHVLQQGQEIVESGVLGQKRFLAKPEAIGKREVPMAGYGGGGAGTERGRA